MAGAEARPASVTVAIPVDEGRVEPALMLQVQPAASAPVESETKSCAATPPLLAWLVGPCFRAGQSSMGSIRGPHDPLDGHE
eukprot:2557823-Prymnesium_polylepis.1